MIYIYTCTFESVCVCLNIFLCTNKKHLYFQYFDTVRIYMGCILNELSKKFVNGNIGLYQDDGLACFHNANGPTSR